MENIIEYLSIYVSIWAPSLTAIIGIAVTIITALSRVKSAVKELKDEDTIKSLRNDLKALTAQNQELVRCNKLLLEKITKIKGYADIEEKMK